MDIGQTTGRELRNMVDAPDVLTVELAAITETLRAAIANAPPTSTLKYCPHGQPRGGAGATKGVMSQI